MDGFYSCYPTATELKLARGGEPTPLPPGYNLWHPQLVGFYWDSVPEWISGKCLLLVANHINNSLCLLAVPTFFWLFKDAGSVWQQDHLLLRRRLWRLCTEALPTGSGPLDRTPVLGCGTAAFWRLWGPEKVAVSPHPTGPDCTVDPLMTGASEVKVGVSFTSWKENNCLLMYKLSFFEFMFFLSVGLTRTETAARLCNSFILWGKRGIFGQATSTEKSAWQTCTQIGIHSDDLYTVTWSVMKICSRWPKLPIRVVERIRFICCVCSR